ncbi:hydroxymethylglutaryl-CoA lyase [Phanerochaete sordida]|uniref:hydroxymethylglutaryl-CoA lyase n=1 Tax=Phanerochaete sordida TaxID=48140 RepID=A0A9P3GSK2_9APHY|nr:hydroxymethylglutaryl-CoA lyase [Phanerochaete sordida]
MLARTLPPRLAPRLARTSSPSTSTIRHARANSTASSALTAVKIVEVGPRDGLQNEKSVIPPEVKIELINRLNRAGLTTIEAGSFVSPKWVPQMAGTADVISRMERVPGSSYPVLVPNLKGLELLLDLLAKHPPGAGTPPPTDEIAIFTAATEGFCKANTNCSIAESLERLEAVTKKALDHGLRVRGYVSVVIDCPYEGRVSQTKVRDVTKALLDMGCYEVSLGDTVGTGTPAQVRALLETLMSGASAMPAGKLAGHYHDTFGTAVANIMASLDMGLRTFDASVGGLGGCPYSPGATGNVATEDVVYALRDSKYTTGADLDAVVDVGDWISKKLNRRNASRAGTATLAKRERKQIEKERENDGGAAESIAAKL